jgi:putative hydrolase of the HAD superfamily
MRGFDHIDTWVFDLDNTLYPASCRLFDQIDRKMTGLVSEILKIAPAEARTVQKGLFHKYGTTLRGLMVEHEVDPTYFLRHAHDIDYAPVPQNIPLDEALHALPGRKLIFTNGTVSHAESVLERLGITRHFNDIFDIVHSDYIPKPERGPYEKFIRQTNIKPETSAMFEDIARNLQAPHDMGMTTILVTSDDNADANILNGIGRADYVHHVTSDLAEFLKSVSAKLPQHQQGASHEKPSSHH